ncbi:MAG: AAA family ATPase [Curvibacter sp.]|nr:AAA family ATPase [Curvibacter sp.]
MSAFVLNTALGLSRNPFPPTPDAGSYFFTPELQEQFAELVHCIEARKGFLLLTGEVGLGKSTLVRRLLDTLDPERTRSALVFNTFLQGEALLGAILRDFGLPPAATLDEGLARFNEFLLSQHRSGCTCLLVIDDAQNLKPDSLELVRLLCNLETAQEKLLQILLAGQPELEAVLDTPELRQLKSRVAKHTRLRGLEREEVTRYFDFRLNAAGGAGRISLQPAAARLLHSATEGNLRRIHLVLDRCLYGLAALGRHSVDLDLMKAALRDVSLPPPPGAGGTRFWPALAGAGMALAVMGVGIFIYLVQGSDRVSAASLTPLLPVARTAETPAPAPASASLPDPGPRAPAEAATTPEPAPASALATATAASPAPALVQVSAPAPEAVVPTQAVAVAAPSAPPAGAAPAPPSEQDCSGRLGAPGAGRVSYSRALPAALVARVRTLRGACLFERNGQPWLLWHDRVRQALSNAVTVSPEARQLQDQLVRQGQLAAAEVDGLYGPRTASALAQFQTAMGLPITATPDELTTLLLEKLDAPATRHD